jgi:putative restriction endonuclease
MNETEFKQKIQNISIWKKGDQRAPHKPLLILYALAQLQSNKDRFIPYKEVKEKLSNLLIEFGPKRKSQHPEEPFVRLKNDGIWDLSNESVINLKNPNNRILLDKGVSGGFNEDVFNLLYGNKKLIQEVARLILNEHFPDTIHEDILNHIGLDLEFSGKRVRNPHFREKILKAYEYSCAVCGFNVRLGNNLVGVEAAHIKWHQAGGPDTEQNGIALCSMHHKLFDRGVFAISEENVFLLAEEAHGTNGFNEWLFKYHGKEIRQPIHPDYYPQNTYVDWHIREVFRGPSRYYAN